MEDALHDGGFVRIDRATAPLVAAAHDVVAITLAAGNAAGFDVAHLAAPGFLRQVLQRQGRHRALEADVDFGDRAIGESLDVDAEERQALIQRSDSTVAAPAD